MRSEESISEQEIDAIISRYEDAKLQSLISAGKIRTITGEKVKSDLEAKNVVLPIEECEQIANILTQALKEELSPLDRMTM